MRRRHPRKSAPRNSPRHWPPRRYESRLRARVTGGAFLHRRSPRSPRTAPIGVPQERRFGAPRRPRCVKFSHCRTRCIGLIESSSNRASRLKLQRDERAIDLAPSAVYVLGRVVPAPRARKPSTVVAHPEPRRENRTPPPPHRRERGPQKPPRFFDSRARLAWRGARRARR